jgi:hypothetical protein
MNAVVAIGISDTVPANIAQECTLKTATHVHQHSTTPTVRSQADLGPIFTSCTANVSYIHIPNRYTLLSFVLNDIIDVNGRISMNDNDEAARRRGFSRSSRTLDMVSRTDLRLLDVPGIQVPSVQTMGEVSLLSSSGANLDLSALVEAGNFTIESP